MKSQGGQCAPVLSSTHGPLCQDVAALVIISGADKLFPVAGLVFQLQTGRRGKWTVLILLFSFYGHHLFCSPSPKNVFGFFGMD